VADSEHVQILRRGPRAWNAWRRDNPSQIPNLDDAALSLGERQLGPINGGPINLRSASIRRAFFRSANLSAADLEAGDLSGANLAYARLDRANLKAANLQGAATLLPSHLENPTSRLEVVKPDRADELIPGTYVSRIV
jgi:hypothetical protein